MAKFIKKLHVNKHKKSALGCVIWSLPKEGEHFLDSSGFKTPDRGEAQSGPRRQKPGRTFCSWSNQWVTSGELSVSWLGGGALPHPLSYFCHRHKQMAQWVRWSVRHHPPYYFCSGIYHSVLLGFAESWDHVPSMTGSFPFFQINNWHVFVWEL